MLTSTRPRCRGCSAFWSADDPGRSRRADLDRDRAYRHVQRYAGLALLVQEGFGRDPFAGDVFVFGRACTLIKALWHDGIGLSLCAKRPDRGRFIWPSAVDGVVALTAAQLGYLLEAIDWPNPQHSWRPQSAG
ncbi:transposase [Bradyrhizobium sp. WSM471]|nr:transposase [Bradyrhizobium sp. WSM471]